MKITNNNLGVIYKATCKVTGKAYIGQTRYFEARKKQHLRAKDDYYFHRAIRKYGPEAFVWEILEQCDVSKLDEREIYWIAYYDTYNNGYNHTKGGDNANALDNWRKTHKEEAKQNALHGSKVAQERFYNDPEYKKKALAQLAEARKTANVSRVRPVLCVELNLSFPSISEAERYFEREFGIKLAHQHIGKVCRGERHTAGGYSWKYL